MKLLLLSLLTTVFAASAPAATSIPQFYLQVTNGTRAGQFLTATLPTQNQTGNVTWTNNLNRATVWTWAADTPDGKPYKLLQTPTERDVLFEQNITPADIYLGTPYTVNPWPVVVNMTGWDSGAAVGKIVLSDPVLKHVRQWDGCGDRLAVSEFLNKPCLQSMQFIRIGSC